MLLKFEDKRSKIDRVPDLAMDPFRSKISIFGTFFHFFLQMTRGATQCIASEPLCFLTGASWEGRAVNLFNKSEKC